MTRWPAVVPHARPTGSDAAVGEIQFDAVDHRSRNSVAVGAAPAERVSPAASNEVAESDGASRASIRIFVAVAMMLLVATTLAIVNC